MGKKYKKKPIVQDPYAPPPSCFSLAVASAAMEFQVESAMKQIHIIETLKIKVPYIVKNMNMVMGSLVGVAVFSPDQRVDDHYINEEEDTEEPVVCERDDRCNAR